MCIIRQLIYQYSEIDSLPKLERSSSPAVATTPSPYWRPGTDDSSDATSTAASTRTPSSVSSIKLFQNLPGAHDPASRDVMIFQKIASVMPEEQLMELLRGVREKSLHSKQDTETFRQMASAMPARSLLHLWHSVVVDEADNEDTNDAAQEEGKQEEAIEQVVDEQAFTLIPLEGNVVNRHHHRQQHQHHQFMLAASVSSNTSTSSDCSNSDNDQTDDSDEDEEEEFDEEFAQQEHKAVSHDDYSSCGTSTIGVDDLLIDHHHSNDVVNILGLSMVQKDEDARQQQEQQQERHHHAHHREQDHFHHRHHHHGPSNEEANEEQDDKDGEDEETFDDETTISYDVSRTSVVSGTSAPNSHTTAHDTTAHSHSGHGVVVLPPPLAPPVATDTAVAASALPPQRPQRPQSPIRQVPQSLCNSLMTSSSRYSSGGLRKRDDSRPLGQRSVHFDPDQLQQVLIVPRLDTEHHAALWWRREEMHAMRHDCAILAEQYVTDEEKGPAYVDTVSRILHNTDTASNDDARAEAELSNLAQHEVCRGLERHILEEYSNLSAKHAKTVLKAQAEFRKRCRWGSHCKLTPTTESTANKPEHHVDALWNDLALAATTTSRKLQNLAVQLARHDFRQAFGYGRMQQRDYRRAFGYLPMAPRRPSGNARPCAVVLKPVPAAVQQRPPSSMAKPPPSFSLPPVMPTRHHMRMPTVPFVGQ